MDSLEDQLWQDYRTILVLGPVSQAAWFPPVPEEGFSGILVAPGLEEARQFLARNPMSRC